MLLEKALERTIPVERTRLANFSDKKSGSGKLPYAQVTINQVIGGMHGAPALPCWTSYVDSHKGVFIRGRPLEDLESFTAERLFWLMLTGEVPTPAEEEDLRQQIESEATVDPSIWASVAHLSSIPPMTKLAIGVAALQRDAEFSAAMRNKVPKDELWRPMLHDAIKLVAKVPKLAAQLFAGTDQIPNLSPPGSDLAARFVGHLNRTEADFVELMRLYLVLHADHENGNASAHTALLTGSTLTDVFAACSAGLLALGGPLHGGANKECLQWHEDFQKFCGGQPTVKALEDFATLTIKAGQVIPGQGHAKLRVPDPRFLMLLDWALKHVPQDRYIQTVELAQKVLPVILPILKPGISNPYPNVDAGSGVLLRTYGVKDPEFQTVLFGVSRCFGMSAQLVLARAFRLPIERPDSVTIDQLEEFVKLKAASPPQGPGC